MNNKISKVIENLNKNNISGFYVETKEEVVPKIAELLNDGDVVSVGGSESLFESGVIDYLRSGRFDFLDRYQKGHTPSQINDVFAKTFSCDAYLCSSNALTENGELYNVDGNSNRVAAICYGPKSVIMVIGINKIVKDMDEAIKRVKTIAAPKNCERLSRNTYCKAKGECEKPNGFEGCSSIDRICCNYLVSSHQRHVGRIKVIIVGESLGY